ncbi:hypothetical protein FJT64_025043 [Amphibalanus amphitrite]|uniref:Uncharacterized protein n=1 Tax=Amphibalanus amphitrite TaxID=1232801 RepID=A0A6A4WJT9_AMPAM|nr:hypothetical protein FJT64_025043 [Amphibalanus amphitrite]
MNKWIALALLACVAAVCAEETPAAENQDLEQEESIWIALALLACVAAVCAEETPAAENQDLEQEESIVHG